MALEESSYTWAEHFKSLKERGLKTLGLTISDAHKGLIKAQEEEFPGTPHQRCMVHWERNLLFRVDVKAIINSIGNARENSLVISIK